MGTTNKNHLYVRGFGNMYKFWTSQDIAHGDFIRAQGNMSNYVSGACVRLFVAKLVNEYCRIYLMLPTGDSSVALLAMRTLRRMLDPGVSILL